ncbi:hypothetical protein HOD75_00330 [archaeon]|jgi:hypothetical protein|nr:hypothetical protein [archaeon]MBT4241322.1 hypothetical protein [archaeon]MBT4418143.1 hypothetical protein [archaeon]
MDEHRITLTPDLIKRLDDFSQKRRNCAKRNHFPHKQRAQLYDLTQNVVFVECSNCRTIYERLPTSKERAYSQRCMTEPTMSSC